MKITVDEARGFFAHPSQQVFGITPTRFRVSRSSIGRTGMCAAWLMAPHPGVWMVHGGKAGRVGPSRRKRQASAARILDRKATETPHWLDPSNLRAAWAFARRCGFVEDGRMPLGDYDIIMRWVAKWD